MLNKCCTLAVIATALAGFAGISTSSAESIDQALASAYSSNPSLNSARAQTRADDENVPLARSGYYPIVSGFADVAASVSDIPLDAGGDKETLDGAVGLTLTQNLFTGFRVRNAVRQAEASVLASRELLRNTEQNVLFDSAQAYWDVLRDLSILDIRQRNTLFLEEQVRAADERFSVGDTTRTDIAQARARLASARAGVSSAEANLAISRATYRRLIGHDPVRLNEAFPYVNLLPRSLPEAEILGANEHPVIHATIHQADAQAFVIKQIGGERLPTVSLEANVQHVESFDTGTDPNVGTIIGRIRIPFFQGGSISARVRQAKEQYGLRKIEIDVARDQVRAAVVAAWAQREAADQAIVAAQEGISAADTALSGVQEEQRVGQRTTLDVLDAQQDFLAVQEIEAIAERDKAVASFALLSAIGRLTAARLNLTAAPYDPLDHYQAVRGNWFGLRTPDGR